MPLCLEVDKRLPPKTHTHTRKGFKIPPSASWLPVWQVTGPWLPFFLEPSSVPKKVGTRFQSHGFHGSGLPIHGSTPLSHGSGTLFHGSALYYVAFSVVLGTTDQLPI